MTTENMDPPIQIVTTPEHTAGLAELKHLAEKIRYAAEHGPAPRTKVVQDWLQAYGIDTSDRRSYVSNIVSTWRKVRGLDDTGEQPMLTDEVLADLDSAEVDTRLTEIAREADHPALTVDRLTEIDELARKAGVDWKPEVLRDFAISQRANADILAEPVQNAEPDPVPAVLDAPERTVTPEPVTPGARKPVSPDTASVSVAVLDTPKSTPAPVQDAPEPSRKPVTPEPVKARDRSVKAFTVAVFVLSALAVITGTVVATHTDRATVLGWSPQVQLTAGITVLVALIGFLWSATSTAAALAAGRTARDVALDIASWVVALIAGFLAAAGQIEFAHWANVLDWKAYLVPGILEPSVVVLLLLANRRVQKAVAGLPTKPIGKLLALAALLGGFAVYTNVVHAPDGSGLVFGAATIIGLILWWVKLQDTAGAELIEDAPHSKRISRRTARYRPMRWVILPAQTTRAWLISLDHSVDDAEIGLDLARSWRRDFEDARTEMKLGPIRARRHASRQVKEHLAERVAN